MRASLLPLTLVLPSSALAAIDSFVCFEGVTGKCTLASPADLTTANGWLPTHAVTVATATTPPPTAPYGGGAPADRPVEIRLPAGVAAPQLLLGALDGDATPAHVAFRRAGGVKAAMPYLTIDFAALQPFVARAATTEEGTEVVLSCDPSGQTTLTYRDANGSLVGTTTWSSP